jgi:hypothetical protein
LFIGYLHMLIPPVKPSAERHVCSKLTTSFT